MLVFMGPPGSGKSTQAKRIESAHGWLPISAGALLRRSKSPYVQEQLRKGLLVDDDIVDEVIETKLDSLDSLDKVILDGFPRDDHEAEWFSEEYKSQITAVVHMRLSDEDSRVRLLGRGRADDTDDAIKTRLSIYHRETDSILAIYEKHGLRVVDIDAAGSVDETSEKVSTSLKGILEMAKNLTDIEIDNMRASGKMLATVLEFLRPQVVDGISGKEIADLAAQELARLGGEPAFLGVKGGPGIPDFPSVICVSISEEVQHGIPSDRIIRDGDVVNLDFGVKYNGMITDSGTTIPVGNISEDAQRLLTGTKDALDTAIKNVKAGVAVNDISATIEDVLNRYKLGIVLELVGHGVGRELHEPPEIPNYAVRGNPAILEAGMSIAVEPITTLGSGEITFASDGWTILSKDNTLSAQFEHTLLVQEDGCEILTKLG